MISSNGIHLVRDVPIAAQTEILVIGGGPAGIGAAVGAARAGRKVLLVEQYGFLGGMATAGLVGPLMTSFSADGKTQIVGGVFDELVRCMEALGGAIHPEKVRAGSPESGFYVFGHDHVTPFDSEAMKLVAAEMVIESGAQLLLHTRFVEPLLEGRHLRGAIIHNKSGLQAVTAEITIDCSADADVAYGAGVPCIKGRALDGLMQPMTMFFRLGNVDDQAVEAYMLAHPEERYTPFRSIVQAAKSDFPAPRDHIGVYRTPEKGVWRVNTTRLSGLDGTDARDLTRAEVEGREQVWALIKFFRTHLPGFQNATLLETAAQIGVRETRHIVGEYTLTAEDLGGTHFEDVIALGSFPVDIHPVSGRGGGIETALAMGLKTAPVYEIPYRSLIPKGVERLLVAGRAISATHEAAGAVRVIPPCFAMGQAAGVAAAIAVVDEASLRQISVPKLQRTLIEQKAILFPR